MVDTETYIAECETWSIMDDMLYTMDKDGQILEGFNLKYLESVKK
jgi:hypothetical protein